jgi:hypothetical protein
MEQTEQGRSLGGLLCDSTILVSLRTGTCSHAPAADVWGPDDARFSPTVLRVMRLIRGQALTSPVKRISSGPFGRRAIELAQELFVARDLGGHRFDAWRSWSMGTVRPPRVTASRLRWQGSRPRR